MMKHPSTTQPSEQNHTASKAASIPSKDPVTEPPAPPPKKKRTGVTRYNPEFAILICERIATTPQSVVKICEAPDMPGVATVFRWLRDHPDFHEIYAEAKQLQAELLIEEALDLVDDTSQDIIVTADGKTVFNRLGFQRCKMRVEYRKWIASKLLPRKYGNRWEQPKVPAPPPDPTPKAVMTETRRKQLIARRRRQMEQPPKENPKSPTKTPPPPTPNSKIPPPNPQSPISDLPTPISESPSPNSDLRTSISEPPPPISAPPSPNKPHRYPWRDIVTPKPKKTTLQKAVS